MIDESSFKILDQVKVFNIMKQVVSALEYIHDRGYAHGDIKAANLMIKNSHQIYLIDFGLAVKFMNNGKHCEYEARAERKHNGTIEYTSRDAHNGACKLNLLNLICYMFNKKTFFLFNIKRENCFPLNFDVVQASLLFKKHGQYKIVC